MGKLALALATGCAAAGLTAGCSGPADPGPPPPSADERQALSDAEAMIPPAEREPAAGQTATASPGEPGAAPVRTPKPPYRTPVPGPAPAQ